MLFFVELVLMISFFRQFLAAVLSLTLVLPLASEAQAVSVHPATVTYDYDAFGNLLHSTGATPNNYLFAGEQFDPDLGLYYNRARYLNVSTGRFWTMDSYEGDRESPISLHKYLYVYGDPVNNLDRSGRFGLEDVSAALGNLLTLAARSLVVARNVLTTVYLTLGPSVPLLIEKGAFYLVAGTAALVLFTAGLNGAATGLSRLANNISAYNGENFPKGPCPCGVRVGQVSQQNLGSNFPAFDNFENGEATQLFSTGRVSTPQALVAAITDKINKWQTVYDSTEVFSGPSADNSTVVTFTKAEATTKNFLVVTPRLSFALSEIASELEELEQSAGLDQIVVQESDAFVP